MNLEDLLSYIIAIKQRDKDPAPWGWIVIGALAGAFLLWLSYKMGRPL